MGYTVSKDSLLNTSGALVSAEITLYFEKDDKKD